VLYVQIEGDTGAKVDDKVDKKDCIRDAVEDDPVRAEVVVKEWYCDRKYDDVCDQQHQHEQVPVKPSHTYHTC